MHASGVQLAKAAQKRKKAEGDDPVTYVNRKALERRKKREAERKKAGGR